MIRLASQVAGAYAGTMAVAESGSRIEQAEPDAPTASADSGYSAQESWTAFCASPGEETFARFYEETRRFVYAICLKMLGSEEEAVDVMQTVYARLLSMAEEPEGPSTPDIDDVIYRITVREADVIRSRYRRRRARDAGPEALEWLADQRPRADVLAHRQQLRDLVRQILQEMTPSLATPVELHFLRGLTHDQVAVELGVSRSAASRLIYKGLDELEKRLRKRGITDSAVALLFVLGLARLRIDPPQGWNAGSAHAAVRHRLAQLRTAPAPSRTAGLVRKAFRGKRPALIAGSGTIVAALVSVLVALHPDRAPAPALVAFPVQTTGTVVTATPAPVGTPRPPAFQRSPASVVRTGPGRLSGRTRTQTGGEPVAGVTVVFEKEEQPVASVTSGADGRFLSPVLEPGDYTVRFEPPPPFGKVSRIALVFSDAGFDLGDILLRRLGRIRGRLLRDGVGPVAGQVVELQNIYEPDNWPRKVTGPDGRFEFDNLPYDNYGVWVAGVQYNPFQFVEMPDGADREIDVIMGDGLIQGFVTRGGQGMPGVEIRAFREMNGGYYSAAIRTVKMGWYGIGQLPAGRYKITAVPHTDKHLQHQKLIRYVDVWGTGSQSLDLVLPSGRMVGQVLLPGGTPAPRARIRVTSVETSAEGSQMPLHDIETSSTADGRFVVEGLPPGRYLAVATAEDGATALAQDIDLPFEGDTRPVVMTLRSGMGATIQASAIDLESHLPLEDAWCDLSTSAGVFRWPKFRTSDGFLLLRGVPPGEYQAEISAFGYSVEKFRLRLAAGESVSLSGRLYPAGGARWTLVTPDHSPAADVDCLLEPINEQGEIDKDVSRAVPGRTGKDGVWTIRGLRPGRYWFSAIGKDGYMAEEVEIFAHNMTERLVRLEKISGRETGEPRADGKSTSAPAAPPGSAGVPPAGD